MASNSEDKGAKRRVTLIPRVKVTANPGVVNRTTVDLNNLQISNNAEGKDSGLSSESTTPTGGSPPPRHSKLIATFSAANRGKVDPRIGSARTSRLLRSRTGTDSPRSLDSVRTRQVASPFRPVLTANGQSPSLDSGDEGSPRLERCNYQQDIVYIKTGQVIFLQGQLEDKDRAIQNLQLQVAKQQDLINSVDSQNSSVSYGSSTKDVSNAATQTEKIRPISAGPSLLQVFPQDNGMGPLVSWSESWNQNTSQRPLSIAEMSSNGTSSSSTKNNRKIERPRTIRPRQEQIQASNRLLNGNSSITNAINLNNNGVAELEKEKSQVQPNSVVRRILKPRDSTSQIIDDEFTKDKSEAPKSCIPALKKPTPRVTRQTNISINRAHNA
ncbi:hypothetical protein G9C98_004454 [Cotesia typhae]|uniref:Uncharacterized protein n=1 Tax=Cotesia typhae TaxID=2053667 RepID=A0A8J5QYT6_9HYME|nr:hypothetical protein G9C98_004454 [Cotesia typhae]